MGIGIDSYGLGPDYGYGSGSTYSSGLGTGRRYSFDSGPGFGYGCDYGLGSGYGSAGGDGFGCFDGSGPAAEGPTAEPDPDFPMPSWMSAQKIVVTPDGYVSGVYDDRLMPLFIALGVLSIKRASNVEYDHIKREWVATHVNSGQVIAQGTNRKAVISSEVRWLEERL